MKTALPIETILPELRAALQAQASVVLTAPPGAGKSTVLPVALLQEPWLSGQKILMLEPRRLAARSVSGRMAQQLQESVGETVGYRIRFENRVSETTRCEVITEGILTRMIQSDNALEGVGLVIFDEFHERNLHADLGLALCLQVQQILRPDLRILIMSATLNIKELSARLNAPVLQCEGRQYPVELQYITPNENEPIPISTAKAIRKAFQEQTGDILAFLPGTADIRRAHKYLTDENLQARISPLYGDLPFAQQQEAIQPDRQGQRKVVLATAIAETSLTIEGITTVVDSGYARIPRFNPRSGLTRLETIRVTQDAADQRAGRAGRLRPGVCYRLWSPGIQRTLVPSRQPEILESDLATLVLELANWGISDPHELTWITPPPVGAINQARELLISLGALSNGAITRKGRDLLKLPTHPRLAHMILSNPALVELAADLAALLDERDPLPRTAGVDLSLRVEALRRWRNGQRSEGDRSTLERIERATVAWRKLLGATQQPRAVVDTDVGRLIMEAYPDRIARQTGKYEGRYKLSSGRMARLPEHDPLAAFDWIAIAELDSGGGEGKIFAAAPLTREDVIDRVTVHEVVQWDDEREAVIATKEQRIGSIVYDTQPISIIPREQRIAALCDAIQSKGLSMIYWDDTHVQWQCRVLSLRRWRPNEPWPDVSDEKLCHTLHEWLGPYLQTVTRRRDFQSLDLLAILNSILPWELSAKLSQLAPLRYTVPSGSSIKIKYQGNGDLPILEVRLQEVFGLLDTPTVNEGQTPVLLHLLSPGFKPVQITKDLKSFWQSGYHEVRKELRVRYPRHFWPEDPWTAEAVRGVKKKR